MMYSWIEAWARRRIAEAPDLTVKQMAEELRIPLRDLYREEFGNATPKKFLTQLRLEQIKRELARDRKRIREVAREFGFCDEFYFSKWFKSLVGMAPKRFQLWSRLNPSDEGGVSSGRSSECGVGNSGCPPLHTGTTDQS
jgi:AraC-like DNA-binding protein